MHLNFHDSFKILSYLPPLRRETHYAEFQALNCGLKCPALLTPPGSHHSIFLCNLYGYDLYHGGPQPDYNIQLTFGEANFDCGLKRLARQKRGLLSKKFAHPCSEASNY